MKQAMHHCVHILPFLMLLAVRPADMKPHRGQNPCLPAVGTLLPGFEYADQGEWKVPFTFIHVTDIQFGLTVKGEVQCEWEDDKANRFVKLVNGMAPKPSFVIMTGDLVDTKPNEPELRERREHQLKSFRDIFSKLDPGVPFLCVPGNHDVAQHPTKSFIDEYRAMFGHDYYSFWYGGIKFIVLNSQLFTEPSLVKNYTEEQDRWLTEELTPSKTAGAKHVILLQHIPWLGDPVFTETIQNKWFGVFNASGVKQMFAGHLHRNAALDWKGIDITVTSALGAQSGNDDPGFRVVEVADKITHKYHVLDDDYPPKRGMGI